MSVIKGFFLIAPNGGGKSTAFQTIIDNSSAFEREIIELKFAGRLKMSCAELMRSELHLLDDQIYKKTNFEKPIIIDSELLNFFADRFEINLRNHDVKKYSKHIGIKLLNPRQVMQYIATEFLRDLEPEIHTNILINEAKKNPDKLIIVTDCNFPNEFEVCTKLGLMSVGIYHPESVKKIIEETSKGTVHESQIHIPALLDKCKIKIINDSTLSVYKNRVVESIKEVIHARR